MALKLYDWIENIRYAHLTLEDLGLWEIGEEREVAIFDRNFEEHWIWDHAVMDQPYTPSEFFEHNKHTITYLGEYEWEIVHPNDGGTIIHNIDLDITSMDSGWGWYPMNGDNIILNEETENYIIHHLDPPIIKNVSEFEPTTRIGWRGPIVMWEDVESNEVEVYLGE